MLKCVHMIEYLRIASEADEQELAKYSPQQLENMDQNQVTPSNPALGGFLAEIFSKLPDQITEWIYLNKNCCFIMAPDGENTKGLHAAVEDLRPHIIILPCDFLERLAEDRKETVRTLLHEVGHGYLKHKGMVSPEVEDLREREADELADKWLGCS